MREVVTVGGAAWGGQGVLLVGCLVCLTHKATPFASMQRGLRRTTI